MNQCSNIFTLCRTKKIIHTETIIKTITISNNNKIEKSHESIKAQTILIMIILGLYYVIIIQ